MKSGRHPSICVISTNSRKKQFIPEGFESIDATPLDAMCLQKILCNRIVMVINDDLWTTDAQKTSSNTVFISAYDCIDCYQFLYNGPQQTWVFIPDFYVVIFHNFQQQTDTNAHKKFNE